MVGPVEEWLLEPDDPSVRYRALTELLDTKLTPEQEREHRTLIAGSKPVKAILSKMRPDGYWLHKKAGTEELVGAGVEYTAAATTHYCLSYLAELGVTRDEPAVKKAAERYLSLQAPDGDWYLHLSCLLGFNVTTFLKLGYRDDERLAKAVRLMLASGRHDGGYLCDIHEKQGARKPAKSCVRGSTKALEAFAKLGPEYWDTPACQSLVDYFLNRNGIYTTRDKSRPVNKDVLLLSFPFLWNAGLLQILYCLAKMGHGGDERLDSAWSLLEKKRRPDGTYGLDWTPTQCPWKVGKRGERNKWTTLYAYLALKRRDSATLPRR